MTRFRRRFFGYWPNLIALAIIGIFFFAAIAAPLLAPPADPANPTDFRFLDGEFDINPLPPSREVPLGTMVYLADDKTEGRDLLHFDVFYSLVWGTRSVLRFGLITALAAALLGVSIGAIGGYIGGRVNNLLMRITDAFLAFPIIAGVWLFRSIMQMGGLRLTDYTKLESVTVPDTLFQKLVLALDIDPVMLTLILFSWMTYARVINGRLLTLRHTEYAMAAQVVGVRRLRIIFRHLLPNAMAPAIILVARDIGGMVIMQAAFAFIGVSGSVDSTAIPEWSRLLMLSRNWIVGTGGNPLTHWWVYLPVTLTLILFGVGWNLLGDGLNRALNPRGRN